MFWIWGRYFWCVFCGSSRGRCILGDMLWMDSACSSVNTRNISVAFVTNSQCRGQLVVRSEWLLSCGQESTVDNLVGCNKEPMMNECHSCEICHPLHRTPPGSGCSLYSHCFLLLFFVLFVVTLSYYQPSDWLRSPVMHLAWKRERYAQINRSLLHATRLKPPTTKIWNTATSTTCAAA